MILVFNLFESLKYIVTFDAEMYGIILLSLFVSLTATLIASLIGTPFAIFMSVTNFRFKGAIKKFILTMMAVPPVVLGLFVVLLISNKGPIGSLELLFTPAAMIIAQTLLVMPIIVGNIVNSTESLNKSLIETCTTLGGSKRDVIRLIIKETWPYVMMAVTLGFSRAISEVGAVMLVGGNIRGKTRVMTTFIALSNSMGDYSRSVAMAIVLLVIAFFVNTSIMKRGVMYDPNK